MALSRTEQPTHKRLEDARKKGQVARSREVDTAVVLVASMLALWFLGLRFWNGLQDLMRDSFSVLNKNPLTMELTAEVGISLVGRSLVLFLPVTGVVLVFSLLAGYGQTAGNVSTQALKPQFSRLNPLKGAKRVFASKQAAMNLAKSLFKVVALSVVVGLTLRAHLPELTAIGLTMDLVPSLGVVVRVAFDIAIKATIALIVLAVVDYAFQRYDWKSQLMMTRQEVKDENRQTEGDPQLKGRMATLRRSLLTRVLQSVPRADVVLTNPTHYAVALKYDPASDQAPRVIAKGERLIALRIREVAMEHGIPIIENPPLTRAIYRAVPVNHEVTPELYEAVAQVLAFVYRLRHPRAGAA
jgi:flagellar biosynthetic protein FlhB